MDIERRKFIAALSGVAVAAPLLVSCSREAAEKDSNGAAAGPTSKSPVSPEVTGEAGTLLSQEPIDTAIKGAKAWRIRYISRDVNNVAHESSGLVIAPAGRGSNRPILTWCHGTTGLGDAACPSAQPDPARPRGRTHRSCASSMTMAAYASRSGSRSVSRSARAQATMA